MGGYPLSAVRLTDPFWQEIQTLVRRVVLPYQWEILNGRVEGAEPSFAIQNFRIAAGELVGEHQGVVFQDSDVYKWLEAVAYAVATERDGALEACADEAVALLGRAQQPDGYLNTFYTIKAPGERFRNLTEGHELYCAGHFFEAAVAYWEATGKPRVLEIAVALAECLIRHFLPGDGVSRGYPGHPEVELGLIRLYEATGREDFLALAESFVNLRGVGENWFAMEDRRGGFTRIWGDLFTMPPDYAQVHKPVREQEKAAGHAVRAMYLYSAMADLARIRREESLGRACKALFESATQRRMYVTGGIGSAAYGERFTADYDLPNDTVYAETCASVGLMMFSERMWKLTGEAACFDVWERALYNTVLAGMGRDGQHFFYVNPLAVDPEAVRENPTLGHVKTRRPRWFGVSCCPPNCARTVLSLGRSLYHRTPEAFFLLSHVDSIMAMGEEEARLSHEGDQYTLTVRLPGTLLKLRVPEGYVMEMPGAQARDGYYCVTHPGGEGTYPYRLKPEIRRLYAHPRIAHDAGRVCVSRGATVYCLEEADNGKGLCRLQLPRDAAFEAVDMDWLPSGMKALRTRGYRLREEGWGALYASAPPEREPVSLVFIPYSQWNNRGEGEMLVWVNEAQS